MGGARPLPNPREHPKGSHMREMFGILGATAVALGLLGSWGAPWPVGAAPAAQPLQASADLRDASGQVVGRATFAESAAGVEIVVVVNGLPPGVHGMHIHTVGRCDPPSFTTASGHFSPGVQAHGLYSLDGPHAGDLPVLVVDEDGAAVYKTVNPVITLGLGNPAASLFDGDGTALIIHVGADDQLTDPDGNSGAAIACGVIRRA